MKKVTPILKTHHTVNHIRVTNHDIVKDAVLFQLQEVNYKKEIHVINNEMLQY